MRAKKDLIKIGAVAGVVIVCTAIGSATGNSVIFGIIGAIAAGILATRFGGGDSGGHVSIDRFLEQIADGDFNAAMAEARETLGLSQEAEEVIVIMQNQNREKSNSSNELRDLTGNMGHSLNTLSESLTDQASAIEQVTQSSDAFQTFVNSIHSELDGLGASAEESASSINEKTIDWLEDVVHARCMDTLAIAPVVSPALVAEFVDHLVLTGGVGYRELLKLGAAASAKALRGASANTVAVAAGCADASFAATSPLAGLSGLRRMSAAASSDGSPPRPGFGALSMTVSSAVRATDAASGAGGAAGEARMVELLKPAGRGCRTELGAMRAVAGAPWLRSAEEALSLSR